MRSTMVCNHLLYLFLATLYTTSLCANFYVYKTLFLLLLFPIFLTQQVRQSFCPKLVQSENACHTRDKPCNLTFLDVCHPIFEQSGLLFSEIPYRIRLYQFRIPKSETDQPLLFYV